MISRLRGRSATELVFRARQWATTAAERVGASGDAKPLGARPLEGRIVDGPPGIEPGDPTSWTPLGLPGWIDAEQTAAHIKQRWPDHARALIDEADKILVGRFRALGFDDLEWGQPVNWHLDPVHQKEAPRAHWSRVPFLDAQICGDHKIVWEVNRQTHLVTLAQAYLLTGDLRYARGAAHDLSSWLDENPPKTGINWASSLEIAFRSIAWTWALYLLRTSGALDRQLVERALAVLHRNARHIERNLSTYFAPNTHLTGEALGLMYVGAFFPFLRGAKGWLRLGAHTLVNELERQVLADGVYYERATWYQWYVVDFCAHASAVLGGAQSAGSLEGSLRASVNDVGTRAARYLADVSRPDGSIPLIGDDDGGQLLRLAARPNRNIRGSIALASAVFGGPDYCDFGHENEPEPVWVLGPNPTPDGLTQEEPRMLMSRAYPFGGVFVMRDRESDEGAVAVVDAGDHGPRRTGSVHSHADALSFDMTVGGQPLFVDPGTFTYTAPPEERDRFREERAHNRIALSGHPIATPRGSFHWESSLDVTADVWCATDEFDLLEASVVHDPATGDVVHRRRIMRVGAGRWLIMDDVGPRAVSYEVQLQCDADVSASRERDALLRLRRPLAVDVLVHVAGPTVSPWQISEAWVSPAYGVKRPAKAVGSSVGEAGGRSSLLICEANAATVDLTSVSADDGEYLRVAGADPAHVLLKSPNAERISTTVASTDADVAWVWTEGSEAGRFLAIRGTSIELADGRRATFDGKDAWSSGTFDPSTTARSGPLSRPEWTK